MRLLLTLFRIAAYFSIEFPKSGLHACGAEHNTALVVRRTLRRPPRPVACGFEVSKVLHGEVVIHRSNVCQLKHMQLLVLTQPEHVYTNWLFRSTSVQ